MMHEVSCCCIQCVRCCCVFSIMNTYRFTGQPMSGVPQRPFVMSPPQLSLTPSTPCFIMRPPPPPPNRVIGAIPVEFPVRPHLPAPMPETPSCGVDVVEANNTASKQSAARSCLVTRPVPVGFSLPPPPNLLPPQTLSPATATCLYGPVLVSDNPPFLQFTPGPSYSMPTSTSQWSAASVSNTTTSSPCMSAHSSSSKLKSSGSADVRAASNSASQQSAANCTKADSELRPRSTSVSSSPLPLFHMWEFGSETKNRMGDAPSKTSTSYLLSPLGAVISTSATSPVVPSTASLKSPPSAKMVTSCLSAASNLSVSAPVFVPDFGDGSHHSVYHESCFDATAVADGPESGPEWCDETLNSSESKARDSTTQSSKLESTAGLYSTAPSTLVMPPLRSRPLATCGEGMSSSTVGRGRKLLLMLSQGAGGVLLYQHALFLFISCMPSFIIFGSYSFACSLTIFTIHMHDA